jgi:hypothetical protein
MAKSKTARAASRQPTGGRPAAARATKPGHGGKKSPAARTAGAGRVSSATPSKGRLARPAARPRQRRTERVTAHITAPIDRRKETVRTPPSSLDMGSRPSAARSGRRELAERLEEHTGIGPVLSGGDLDADWAGAYSVGDEAAGGDNPTPDQQIVDDIGRALGVEYQGTEELKGSEKITGRDRHRWELDPASSEDYKERTKDRKRRR